MSSRENRDYRLTDISTLRDDVAVVPIDRRDLLFKLYEQTCTTWRALIDVRFKLLALVPTISLISLATIFSGGQVTQNLPLRARLLFAVLGFIATIGLLIYDLRNSQLHDDLISRGRKIEDELGVDTCVFRGRKQGKGIIKHDNATILVYGTALVAWLSAIWLSVRAI